MRDIDCVSRSFGSDVLEAVIVQLPSIDFAVVVGVDLPEEFIKLFLDHLFVEEGVLLKLFPNPCLELFALEDIAPVFVMLKEDVLDERLAVRIHDSTIFVIVQYLTSIKYILSTPSSQCFGLCKALITSPRFQIVYSRSYVTAIASLFSFVVGYYFENSQETGIY